MNTYTKYYYLKRRIVLCLLAGATALYAAPEAYGAAAVVPNNELPAGGASVLGGHTGLNQNAGTATNPVMNIRQNGKTGVITWDSFNIGANAVVNFSADAANFNTLNYVKGSIEASQIYGTINAAGGNIYVVNPAGVQIGPSAQINAGGLHVSAAGLTDEMLSRIQADTNMEEFMNAAQDCRTDAELMSLGNINAGSVSFESNGRIVIDTERVRSEDNKKNEGFVVRASDASRVLLGYDAYDEANHTYAGKDKTFANVQVNGEVQGVSGYMWVEDARQLQAMDTNLGGKYALRNSIDATGTAAWHDDDGDTVREGFKPVGVGADGKVSVSTADGAAKYGFYGAFDGLDYNIFGLTINRGDTDNVGLFGVSHDADISRVTLVGGSITGRHFVGSVAGAAVGNTHIRYGTNSAAVTGHSDVGGIVGYSGGTVKNAGEANRSADVKTDAAFDHLVNMGTILSKGSPDGSGSNVSNAGGLIGYLYHGDIKGTSYNIGDVSGEGYNVGGLVGHAVLSEIGNDHAADGRVYNGLDVTGAYNVGGIVGNMEGTTVQHAENHGDVHAEVYTTEDYTYHSYKSPSKGKTVAVQAANVGGIAGTSSTYDGDGTPHDSRLRQVLNDGNISSHIQEGQDFFTAGNVGGIVGKAVNTDITAVRNRENAVRGAHNVGGVAGYFGSSSASGTYTLASGLNDGGDVTATGARNAAGFVTELIRDNNSEGTETTIIGNMGGIAGYLNGGNVYVTQSANSSSVHSLPIASKEAVSDASKAGNTGGIIGKLDRDSTKHLNDIKSDTAAAAVSESYNSGNIRGFINIGGVVGMMFNGEVADSYNLGTVNMTRTASPDDNLPAANIGGIVGDTTESGSAAKALLYNVYNKGEIGDKTYTYYARHVGGVVGRLNGIVDTSYNAGDIYNGYNVVGGITGFFYGGKIRNSFNTGNVTVVNNDSTGNLSGTSSVGGIAGAGSRSPSIERVIESAYNLGTIRSYQGKNRTIGNNSVGGIIGRGPATLTNVYTTGNLYAADADGNSTTIGLGSLYGIGTANDKDKATVTNGYYIAPQDTSVFTDLNDKQGTRIAYTDRQSKDFYKNLNFSTDWRIYEDQTTPILNTFMPKSAEYFGDTAAHPDGIHGIDEVQYGTAYDPLLTIVRAKQDVTFNWSDLGLSGEGRLAVYGGGLTLNGVDTAADAAYYGGLLYSDGALTLNAKDGAGLGLGTGAALYGSSVSLRADGTVTVYGDVTATGNGGKGDIAITAGDVDIYGTLISATGGETVAIPGIAAESNAQWKAAGEGAVSDPGQDMNAIGNWFSYTTDQQAAENGDITITAGTKSVNGQPVSIGQGHAHLYFGNKQDGLITTQGSLTVTGRGDVFVDSDLALGGDLLLKSTGPNGEVVLDITHIGQVQARQGMVPDSVTGLSQFMKHFSDINGPAIALNAASGDAKFAVDLWDETANGGAGGYTFKKFGNQLELKDTFNRMNALVNGQSIASQEGVHTNSFMYLWVRNAEQLQGIQDYYENGRSGNESDTDALNYNYALKGDINASNLKGYTAIGTDSDGYMGIFDGRGHAVIGLDAAKGDDGNRQSLEHAGVFSQVGQSGTVKNVHIYSSTFDGSQTAGAVAGVNKGTIAQVRTFGNTVSSQGSAGGVAGINTNGEADFNEAAGTVGLKRGIYDVESVGSVIAKGGRAVAGGIAGTNEADGVVDFSYSNSAVATDGTAANGGLGGVVGYNQGGVYRIDSLGVTNGGDSGSSHVGGAVGINDGTMYNAYNESVVSGKDAVGGIVGVNQGGQIVSNVVNAAHITGTADSQFVGGLIGDNSGIVKNGRNNGEIIGNQYIGGLVGKNEAEAKMERIVNDSSAAITGDSYVGGIAGSNTGVISATGDEHSADGPLLVNRGKITGREYVGGVAGSNEDGGVIENTRIDGTLENIKNTVELHVKPGSGDARYFGGVAGINQCGATITNAMTEAEVYADGATYVGGIVGLNEGALAGEVGNVSNVIGSDFVGGVAGENQADFNGLTASNTGEVKATKGGAGGLFGQNGGAMTDSSLINSGTVVGTTGAVGGLIGTHTGTVSRSQAVNTAGAQVAGQHTVGGLIGDNQGSISGGRDDKGGYYKYQVYNNGVVSVGTWTDADGDKLVDAGEIHTGAAGENIGGLVGMNRGVITAAYNTGAVDAAGSVNVGGIAGSNSGTGKINQVFSHIMTADGTNEAVQGKTNVGGIVGANSGTVSNAYSAGEARGDGAVGAVAGDNTGTLANVYGTGTLVGAGTAAGNGYDLSDPSFQQTKKSSYGGYDFAYTWRIYDGSSTPLLKVFLTTLTMKDKAVMDGKAISIDEYLGLTYTGREQDLDIQDLIAKGFLTGPDGMDAPFAAYDHTTASTAANGNGSLLYNTKGQVDARDYTEWLASAQISRGHGESFAPNNLGYDVAWASNSGKISVDKATLDVALDDIYRIYGNSQMHGGGAGGRIVPDYQDFLHLTATNGKGRTLDVQGFDDDMRRIRDRLAVADGAADGIGSLRQTNDTGSYDWSVTFDASVLGNYKLKDASSLTVTAIGKSHVAPAALTIRADDLTIPVGMPALYTGSVSPFVNGDVFGPVVFGLSASDTSKEYRPGWYAGVIGFQYGGAFYGQGSDLSGLFVGNYDIRLEPGDLTVTDRIVPDIYDAPFGRKEDFRERKAEIRFVDGGMEL